MFGCVVLGVLAALISGLLADVGLLPLSPILATILGFIVGFIIALLVRGIVRSGSGRSRGSFFDDLFDGDGGGFGSFDPD